MNDLYTPEGEALCGTPWQEYPRPRLKRDSYLNLNGDWDFGVSDRGEDERYDRTIRVPFPPESLLSGIHEVFPEGKRLCYRRCFTLPDGFCRDRVILHFGAVDQIAEVFVNGQKQGTHVGGYDSFSFDITSALAEENILTVLVRDHLDTHILPYGKQRRDRGGMWYTPVSGIWQTVWLESVANRHIRGLQLPQDPEDRELIALFDGEPEGGTVTVTTPEGTKVFPLLGGKAYLDLGEERLWSPEEPYLYRVTVETPSDRVESYFALRRITVETVDGSARLCLNGRPYFFHGLLDQGYYSDGLFTPACLESYRRDITEMKALGFNMLRKHIKIEPELFYYECDRLGMAVFQDMVNNGDYSFLRDTALPTVGHQVKDDRRLHRDGRTRKAFLRHMEQTVAQRGAHPSICLWTVFNEGWGQFCGSEVYARLKALDPTRPIDTASGWFRGCESDVDSRHVYFRRVRLKAKEKPLYLSEFGGYSHRVEGHIFNPNASYGYGSFKGREELVQAIRRLYAEQVLPLLSRGLSAVVYTQVSDVEDEVNGILTYDRRVCKVLPEEFADISAQLRR